MIKTAMKKFKHCNEVLSSYKNEYLFGIGEILRKENTTVKGFSLDQSIDLIEKLGAKSHRLWVDAEVLNPDCTINKKIADDYHHIIKRLYEIGVKQIIFHGIFYCRITNQPSSFFPTSDFVEYKEYLLKYEKLWFVLANEFNEIALFETGNENNFGCFLTPKEYEYGKKEYSYLQKAAITTDLMFHSNRGIKKANPNAFSILPGLSPGETGTAGGMIEDFLTKVYENILSGQFGYGSVNARDYFDGIAIHPYNFIVPWSQEKWGEEPTQKWVNDILRMYDVVLKYDPEKLKFFLTEYGFSDFGNSEHCKEYAQFYVKAFDLIQKYMPFVETVHIFRLFEDTEAQTWGGKTEIYYGLFKEPQGEEGFKPKPTAYSIQKIFNGKGNLEGDHL